MFTARTLCPRSFSPAVQNFLDLGHHPALNSTPPPAGRLFNLLRTPRAQAIDNCAIEMSNVTDGADDLFINEGSK